MVAAVRNGQSQRRGARQFGVSLATVQLWVQRAKDTVLDHVHWEDSSHAPHHQAHQTSPDIEERILQLRQELAQHSDLGERGAQAIRRSLLALENGDMQAVPSVATINRILAFIYLLNHEIGGRARQPGRNFLVNVVKKRYI